MRIGKQGVTGLAKRLLTGLAASTLFLSACSGPTEPEPKPKPTPPPIVQPPPPPTQPTNRAPIVTQKPDTTLNELSDYRDCIAVSDPDGDTFYFKPSSTFPEGLRIVSNCIEGKIPEVLSDSIINLNIEVRDNHPTSPKSSFYNRKITVENVRNAWDISSGMNPLMEVQDSLLVFTNPVSYVSGDIIASNISSTFPNGFLGKIKSVSADGRTVQTGIAPLEEILGNGDVSLPGELIPNSSSAIPMAPGVGNLYSTSNGELGFKLNNVTFGDDEEVVVNGNVAFGTDFDFELNARNFRLNRFKLGNTSTVSSDITFSADAFDLATKKEIILYKVPYAPIILFAGGVPVPIVPVLEVGFAADLSHLDPLSVRITQESNFEAGLVYTKEFGWGSSYANFDNNFNIENPPVSGTWSANGGAFVRMNLLIGGFIGPNLSVSSGLEFKTQDNCWNISGTLDASTGVSVPLTLGKGLSAYFKENLISHRKLLAECDKDTPTQNYKIAFTSIEVSPSSRQANIRIMNADGSELETLLGNKNIYEENPAFSPDGSRLAYNSYEDGDGEIYILDLNTREKTKVTDNIWDDSNPAFSPNGKHMVFISKRDGNGEVYKINLETLEETRLTQTSSPEYNPKWSPNGEEISFTSDMHGEGWQEIYKMNSDGTGITRLTSLNEFGTGHASWSPDGSRIVFTSAQDRISLINPDGSNLTHLYQDDDFDFQTPSFSPDGTTIAYVRKGVYQNVTKYEVWTMDSNGTSHTQLTNDSFYDISPVWSPVPISSTSGR